MIIPGVAQASPGVAKVICVPWQGNINKYHTTWSGLNVMLKGVIKTDSTATIYYRWDYGDGVVSSISSLSGKTKYNVETMHVYTGSEGTPFTAKLIAADDNVLVTNRIDDNYLVKIEAASLDSKINVAIDNGLWYLYKSGSDASSNYHTFDGSPFMVWSYSSYYASPTASAVQAFEINGHLEAGNPDEDPYAEYVKLGLNWLFNGYYYNTSNPMLKPLSIATQHGSDNPDTNGNGKGIETKDYGYRPIYQGGMVIDAIIASGTPDADSGRDFDGDGTTDTYAEVVQDMCDMYAYGQYDGTQSFTDQLGTPRSGIIGGWRYNWGEWPDNSACQWGSIGMIPAQESPWNCDVPSWVKNYNDTWLWRSFQAWTSGGVEWGGFGYTSYGYGDALTPSGMVQLAFDGTTTSDPRWVRSERWLADHWVNLRNSNNVYAYYAFSKAMRLAQPDPVVTFSSNNYDWYRGGGGVMGLAEKIADRLVTSNYWDYYGPNLGTAWCVIILKPVLFAAAPIACFDADPNPGYPDSLINFDPSCSGHSEPGKDIDNLVLYQWDWNNDGIFDESTTTPDVVTHSFSCAVIPCTYPVTLKVTDDSVPARTATYVTNIVISNPPHPPVSKTGGPYMLSLCEGDTLTLDGTSSYDPDEGEREVGCGTCPADTITAYEWDLDGAPWSYPSPPGATGAVLANAESYFTSEGQYDIGLRVTDNTQSAYPGSLSPNLTDEDFTTVNVYDGCICDLNYQVGCGLLTLSWDDIGADMYYIFESTEGPNSGFEEINSTTDTIKHIGQFVMGLTSYYRVMAKTGNDYCLSKAITVYADPELCNPTADADGPYRECAGDQVTLDGSASAALVGTIVAWDWDLDSDGQYDDAFGETVVHTWNTPGTYTVGLQVTSSDSLVLTDEDYTTVEIVACPAAAPCPVKYRWSQITLPFFKWDPFPKKFKSWNQVQFINNGPGDMYNVTATVSCAPVNVTVVDGIVSIGTIPGGGSAWSIDDFALITDMTNPQPPNKGICWRVEYDDAAGNHHVVENVAKFCGENCASICP